MSLNLKHDIRPEENATHDVHYVCGNNMVTFNGFWEVNVNARHLFWDQGNFSIHGLLVEAQHYISIIDVNVLLHPEDAPYLQHKFDELRKGIPLNDYFRLITPSGEIKIIHYQVTVQKTKEKQVFTGTFSNVEPDIFETDALPEAPVFARTGAYAEQMARYGSWQINLHSHETLFSKHIYRIYDIIPGSLKAHPDTFTKFIHPDDKAIVTETLDKALNQRLPLNIEYRIVTYRGEMKYVCQVSTLSTNEAGQELLTGITIDITEKKMLELSVQENRESLEFEREIFKLSERITQTGRWQTNLSTRKTWFSDNFYRIYGLRPGVLKEGHDSFTNFIYQEDRELVAETMKSVFEDHLVPQLTFRIFRPDGKLRHISLHGKLLANAEREMVMIGIIHDITDSEMTRKNLKKATQKHAVDLEIITQLEQTGAVGNWQMDLQSNQLVFSENFFRIYGLKPQASSISFEYFEKFIHPDDHKFIKEIYAKILTERWSVPIEYKILPPDGQLRHLKAENKILRTGDGYQVLMGTIRDVTEHINVLQELQNRIQFIELLSDNIPEMLVVTDTNYNIISCNHKFEQTYKVRREEINEKNIFETFPVLKQPSTIDNLNRALNGEAIRTPDIHPGVINAPLHMDIFPLKEPKGNVIGILIMLHDVSGESLLREQLSKYINLMQNLLEFASDKVMVLDENLHYLFWNKRCEDFYNAPAKEVIGKHVLDFFPSFKKDPAYSNCLRALSGETVLDAGASGSSLFNVKRQYFIPLKDSKKKIYGILWLMFDAETKKLKTP